LPPKITEILRRINSTNIFTSKWDDFDNRYLCTEYAGTVYGKSKIFIMAYEFEKDNRWRGGLDRQHAQGKT
jgi:hypothetical protein